MGAAAAAHASSRLRKQASFDQPWRTTVLRSVLERVGVTEQIPVSERARGGSAGHQVVGVIAAR